MSAKRWLAIGVLAAGLAVSTEAARAEEATPKKEDEPAPAPKEAAKKKDPFFGDRFAMYLETRGGPASIDAIDNPVTSGVQSSSDSEIRYNGTKAGQFTVGWTLPRGRGQYLLSYNAMADGDYELDATGSQLSYQAVNGQSSVGVSFPLPWWHVTIRNGVLNTTQTPPVWDSQLDDANGNALPDFNEIRYPAPPTVNVTASVPKDLGTRIQTWDLAYRREFGGLRIHSRWMAGIRHLKADGAILTPTWLTGAVFKAGFGYSDGVLNNFILLQQSTSGTGPVGSGDIEFSFFKQRLTLYAEVKAAFLVQSLTADSGSFTYYAPDPSLPNSLLPGAGRINRKVDKTAWNTTFEAGARVKLMQGFHLIVDWNRTGYLDTILIPTSVAIPANASQTQSGTTARFVSRDFIVSTINLGLSFQF